MMLFSSDMIENRNTCNNKLNHLSLIRSGVSGTLLKSIITNLPEQKFVICCALSISPKSLPRLYLQPHLNTHVSERILDILDVYWQIFELYDDTKLVQELLDTSLPALNNEKLSEYVGTFIERRIAKEIIKKMKFGEFT
jgi:hypothetical protein